ncbi:T9SS type A sorting domain-containing protein [Sandaracinomonas limnophila]|uniref:T9SS type A sorting domain-containing protein n=1 Tax=Sandaracinomonas limnophila TaxID=1862386 RepID=A0A437PRS7_9BACT|nr:T9SS type A sorting domain-containing protein [Sandaracinomonas limnophila]RVU24947.1 T9SS type A sorting domain-containing protein [Sandaracinomonas limnophila]
MKSFLPTLVCIFFTIQLFSQKPQVLIKKGKEIVEYVSDHPELRPLPSNYQAEMQKMLDAEKLELRTLGTQASLQTTFNFTYDLNTPTEVKAVFEKAASIWEKVFTTDQKINVIVYWTPLASNVLGSAGATNYYANFPGSSKINTYYPLALAEKIAHANFNGTDPDIVARFNSDFTQWYKGIDGLPSTKQYDFLSVVLHELGHGLGFIGQFEQSTDKSTVGYTYPGIFDQFMENKTGTKLVDTTTSYKNNSVALLGAVTSKTSLFLNGPQLQNLNKTKATLYAPNPYVDGSSVYHVDQYLYPVGDPNALMTPQIAPGEVTRSVGPIAEGIFKDMGWYGSSIFAEQAKDTEATDQDFVFEAKLYSDTLLKANSLRLMLASNTSITSAVAYTPTLVSGTSNTYRYTLPKSSSDRVLKYYWTAQTAAGKSFVTPAEAPYVTISGKNYGNYYQFTIGADTVKPKVVYANSLKYIFASQKKVPLPTLYATDNIGIDTVLVEYSINGGTAVVKNMSKLTTEANAYSFTFDFTSAGLKSGDVVKYKITVRDKSKAKNVVYFPSTSYYEFRVVDFLAPVTEYITSFDRYPTADFYLKGFSINKDTYLNTIALNSEHPYADGSEDVEPGTGGTDKFTNNDALLLKPIVVRADTAKIYFDQIVLVEPGETGESFYNADGTVNRYFYDYVIVQASKDLGQTWIDLGPGYDSNKESTWLKTYNLSLDKNGNSLSVGSFDLYKPMEIDLKSNGKIKSGDQIILRFRLHADVGAHGWGWAIDNLNIQGPKGKKDLVLGIDKVLEGSVLSVFPNPANSRIKIKLETPQELKQLNFQIVNLQGQAMIQEDIQVNGVLFEREIEVNSWSSGAYWVNFKNGSQQIGRKLIIIK